MNRLVKSLTLLVFLGAAAVASAQTLRVTADRTNLRDRPATDGAIVAPLAKGDELEVVEKSGTWYRVRVKSTGAQGYVNSLVVEVTQAAASPAPASPPPPPPAPVPPPRPAASAQPAAIAKGGGSTAAAGGDRNYFIRVFGGLWSGGQTTGAGFGGGVAGRPFGNDQIEVQGDFAYARQGVNQIVVAGDVFQGTDITDLGARLFQGSGTLLYNFKLSSQTFTPFAGLGLEYADEAFVFTDRYSTRDRDFIQRATVGFSGISLQAVAGIEKPISDKRAFRGELRATAHGVLLLGGLSF